jgi:molecular chaperone DnaK (HSP70)
MPQIEVTFDIDANGIVHVAAKDLGTGKEQAMTITGGTALPKDEIEKMMREAERFAEEDRRRRELAEAKNTADNLAYQTEKTLKEHGSKLSEADRRAVEQALAEVKDALKTDDTARIKASSDALVNASHKLAEQIYQTGQSAAGQGGGATADGSRPSDDDVVDAEIVEEGGSSGAGK